MATTPDSAWQSNSSFNPYGQTFVITAPDGVTAVPAYMKELLILQGIATSQGIIYGIQIGLTGLLFIILMLMTKQDKRRSAIFFLNSLALLFCLVRNILAVANLSSIFYNYYNWQLHYYPLGSVLTTAQNLSAAAEVFNVLIVMAIYSSLLMQIYIVCCTVSRAIKLGILGICGAVALTAIGIRLFLAVFNVEYGILGVNSTTADHSAYIDHIASINNLSLIHI